MTCLIIADDCRTCLDAHGPFDLVIADPPYGDTSLDWDRWVEGWIAVARRLLMPTGSLWCFGSMRFFITYGPAFAAAGLRYAQDAVWEKHNGSSFHADRLKRVHEHVVQFYRDDSKWGGGVFNVVPTTPDAMARTVSRRQRPPHFGNIEENGSRYESVNGGDRLMRSVIPIRSAHGRAIHPTEKPCALLEILIAMSCPPGGIVADMFAGSGAAGEVCARTGRRYVGAEIDVVMAGKAYARISGTLPLGGDAGSAEVRP